MKIIKEGKTPKTHTNTCPLCSCEYEYEDSDIHTSDGLTTATIPYVICPWCGKRNNISSITTNWPTGIGDPIWPYPYQPYAQPLTYYQSQPEPLPKTEV